MLIQETSTVVVCFETEYRHLGEEESRPGTESRSGSEVEGVTLYS